MSNHVTPFCSFVIAAISDNAGSFGHRGHVLIANSGEAWEVQRVPGGGKPDWQTGTVVVVELTGHNEPQWAKLGVECPRRLPDCPPEIVAKAWGKLDTR